MSYSPELASARDSMRIEALQQATLASHSFAPYLPKPPERDYVSRLQRATMINGSANLQRGYSALEERLRESNGKSIANYATAQGGFYVDKGYALGVASHPLRYVGIQDNKTYDDLLANQRRPY